MQRRGGSGQSVKEQRTTRQKTRKAPTTHVSAADFIGRFAVAGFAAEQMVYGLADEGKDAL
ncbi:MAG: hypothetical protein WA754_17615 [Pseudolabrys sp.]